MSKTILYHGTDERILLMKEEERASFKSDCVLAIDYMWQFLQPLYELWKDTLGDSEELKEFKLSCGDIVYSNVMQALNCNKLRLNKRGQYSYDYTYLTAEKANAILYARSSNFFGEIGQVAFRFYEAIKIIKPDLWNPSDEVVAALDKIIAFAAEEAIPVVVVIKDYDIDYLYRDNGKKITKEDVDNDYIVGHFYYTKELSLNKENTEWIYLKPKPIYVPM